MLVVNLNLVQILYMYQTPDHSYALGDCESTRKRLHLLEERVDGLQKQVKNTAARERRLRLKCADLIKDMKEKNLINDELEQKLRVYKGTCMFDEFKCIRNLNL